MATQERTMNDEALIILGEIDMYQVWAQLE